MQTKMARVVRTAPARRTWYGLALMLVAALSGGRTAGAADAANSLAQDGWAAWAPGLDYPPLALSTLLGTYRSAEEAFAVLNDWGTHHGPTTDPAHRLFTTGLTEPPFASTSEFRPDPDNDGEVDVHIYSQPVQQFRSFPHNCSNGDDAAHLATGGGFNLENALLFERQDSRATTFGPLLSALCEAVYCRRISGCRSPIRLTTFDRVVLPTFVAKRDLAHPLCPDGTEPVHEDLLGRPASGETSCRHRARPINDANLGEACPLLQNGSNPVNTVTGNKYQREPDYIGTVHGELRFVRHYNSQLRDHRDLGIGWTHSYSGALQVMTAANGDQTARLLRPDGRTLTFNKAVGAAGFTTDPIVVGTLRAIGGSPDYEFSDGDDVHERYGLAVVHGDRSLTSIRLLLVAITDPRSGRREQLAYNAARQLQVVHGRYGRDLRFEYTDSGLLAAVIDPAGQRYTYTYDEQRHLLAVIFPDADDRADDADSRVNNPQRRYRYDDARWRNGLTAIIDENGTTSAQWGYDTSGRALFSEHAGGAEHVDLDYHDTYTAVTDTRGQTRSFNITTEYGIGLVTAVTGGDCNFCGGGPVAATSYDGNGFRNLVTDHEGNVTDYDYDAQGLELRRSSGSGGDRRVVTTVWDVLRRLPVQVTVSDGSGYAIRRTTSTYWQGLLKSRSEEDLASGSAARTTRLRYFGEDDPADPRSGLLRSVDGPRTDVADITTYDYDPANGNLAAITDAAGQVTRMTRHDAHGRVLARIDANGTTTELVYDARGRLLRRTVGAATTQMHYDASGQLLRITLPDQAIYAYSYDDAHRLIAVADGLGNTAKYTLDALGNRVKTAIFDSAGRLSQQTVQVYGQRNLLTRTVGGAGQKIEFAYDQNGDLRSTSDPRGSGRTSSVGRDTLRRVSQLTNAFGGVTQLAYDLNDQVTRAVDPRAVTTRYRYNGYGDLLEQQSPDAGVSNNDYDAAGNRTVHRFQQVAGTDITVRYDYDPLNRLRKIDYPNDPDVTFDYDENPTETHGSGRLTTMRDAGGTTSFRYDERGNLATQALQSADRTRLVTRYGYDLADRLHSITYPSGMVVTYTRDGAGQIAAVDATIGTATTVLARDVSHQPFGPVARLTLGNGVTETRSYDLSERLTTILSSSARLPSYRYTDYDAADNLLRIEERFADGSGAHSDERRFRYDALNRLIFESSTARALSYTYLLDAGGNRRVRYITRSDGTARVDDYNLISGTNRFSEWRHAGHQYDASGNLVASPSAAHYGYDEAGRLRVAAGGTASAYWQATYNGLGERVLKKENRGGSRQTLFVYAETGELLSATINANGQPSATREYVWLEGRPLAEYVHDASGSHVNYLHVNLVNQLQYMTNSAGAMTMRSQRGDAYGDEVLDNLDVDADGYQEHPLLRGAFPGQIDDGLTYYNRYRNYEPKSGRYLESDPIGLAGGLNTYTYAENNPNRFIDPDGLAVLGAGTPGRERPVRDAIDLFHPSRLDRTDSDSTTATRCFAPGGKEVCSFKSMTGRACTYACPTKGTRTIFKGIDIEGTKWSACPMILIL